jgi:hypothetical protein
MALVWTEGNAIKDGNFGGCQFVRFDTSENVPCPTAWMMRPHLVDSDFTIMPIRCDVHSAALGKLNLQE